MLRCDCISDFYANNITSPLNQYTTDYSCNLNHHIDYPKKFSSWHYSRDYQEALISGPKDCGIKSNSMRPTSLSTEHLHQDVSVTNRLCHNTIEPINSFDAFNSCSDSDCLCSLGITPLEDHETITECNKCMKCRAYQHEHLCASSERKKYNPNSDSHNLIISNPGAVADSYDLSDQSRDSSCPDDPFNRMLHFQTEMPDICNDSLEDGSAKTIEEIERYYGGRLRTQRAAKIIQNAYRDYRLRAEYARLRAEKDISRIGEQNSSKTVPNRPNVNHISSKGDCVISQPSNDVDDLVIEKAYMDWSREANVNQTELQNPFSNGTLLDDGLCHKTHHYTSQCCPKSHTDRLQMVSDSPMVLNYLSPGSAKSNLNKQNLNMYNTNTMHFSLPNSTVNYNNELIHLPSEHFYSSSIKESTVTNSPQPKWVSSLPTSFLPCSKMHVNPGCENCSCTRQTIPTQQFVAECFPKYGDISPNSTRSSLHRGVYLKNCCAPPPPSVLNRSSIRNNCCPYCINVPHIRATPTVNTPPALVCIPASRDVMPPQPCNNNECSVITYPMEKVCKTPAVLSSCVPLNNELLQLHSAQLVVPNVPINQLESLKINNNDAFQKPHHVHASCRVPCYHIPNSCQLHVHRSYLSHNPTSQTIIHPAIITSFSHRNPCINRLPNVQEKRRKRAYRIGLNIFNKSPVKGIDFLVKNGFLENSPELIARFLLTRKGLSRVAIGEYLGDTKNEVAQLTTRQFIRELKFQNKEVDEALRLLLGCFRTPGESQKIVHLLNEFQSVYVEQNASYVKSQFRNSDTIMILAYAIVMLHTDMYSPNVRPQSKMTKEEFVRNLRGVDSGEDLDRDFLLGIYDRIKSQEMSVQPDHTDQVRKIQQHLTGPQKPLNLSIPQRRLVCYCRLYEVPDKNKRERSGAHQRELFLFNDLLLITKSVQKRRRDASVAYQVRMTIQLLGVKLVPFETIHHPNGLELLLPVAQMNPIVVETPPNHHHHHHHGQARILITLNTKTSSDRARLLEDLQECILEVTEMERLRREEIVKQKNHHQTHQHQHHQHCSGYNKMGLTDKQAIQSTNVSSSLLNKQQHHTCSSVHHNHNHNHLLSSSPQHNICSPISSTTTCLMNHNIVQSEPSAIDDDDEHCHQHHHHHYKLPDGGQRLSGDSGLMADLDAASSS
ncbi:unnamed protein product [Schistosoma turkestanicum]|nr:unnamed protein product [Schistosoma turkestanicum]